MIVYLDILKKLSDAGYNTTRIRKEKLISEYTLQSIREGRTVTLDTINTICKLTGLPVEKIIEYHPD